MTINENGTRTLPKGWRTLENKDLDALADELEEAGEWALLEDIQVEQDERELEENLPAYDDSLEDRGIFLGSYAS